MATTNEHISSELDRVLSERDSWKQEYRRVENELRTYTYNLATFQTELRMTAKNNMKLQARLEKKNRKLRLAREKAERYRTEFEMSNNEMTRLQTKLESKDLGLRLAREEAGRYRTELETSNMKKGVKKELAVETRKKKKRANWIYMGLPKRYRHHEIHTIHTCCTVGSYYT